MPPSAIPSRDLQALFQHCNRRYFDSSIVPSPGFTLRFSRSVKLSGCFTFSLKTHEDWGIAIASRLQDHPRAALSTMTHEMIHMLAHQRFRETGDRFYLDEAPVSGQPFANKGHGAFFLSELARLNRDFSELQIDVKSQFGDGLYDKDKIPRSRLLLVSIDKASGRGMIYRLHEKAANDWQALRATASAMHGDRIDQLCLVEVDGHLAEGYPMLRKDNAARKTMLPVRLKDYERKATALLSEETSSVIPEHGKVARLPARAVAKASGRIPAVAGDVEVA